MQATITSARTTELRKANRYRLNAPVLFLWAPQNGSSQSGEGVTRDISASGVCVLANCVPPVGSRVLMDILLPKLKDSGPGMYLNGEGIVVRVEPRGKAGKVGFAAEVQFYPEASEMFLSHLNYSGWVI